MRFDVKVDLLEGRKLNVPRDVYAILKEANSRVDQKLDGMFIITGKPGTGKSNMAKCISGTWMEHFRKLSYTLDNVHFSSEAVIERTNMEHNIGEVIHYDEAVQGGTSLDGMSKIGKIFRKAMITKRRKRHLYVPCVDSLKELNDKLIERTLVWFHVFMVRSPDGKYMRGLYKTFSAVEALMVYKDLKDRKYWTIEDHPIFKRNRNVSTFPLIDNLFFDEDEYDQKKSEMTDLLDEKEDKIMNQRNNAIMCALEHGVKRQIIAKAVGLNANTISDIKRKVVGG